MFPTPYTIQVLGYVAGAEDAHGNIVDTWADPVTLAVYGWAPTVSDEPKLAGRDQVIVDLEVFAPPTSVVGARDKAVVDGKTYTVEGEPEDFNHGPWQWAPGVVLNLARTEG